MSSGGKRSFLDVLGSAAAAPTKKQDATVATATTAEAREVKANKPVEAVVKATPEEAVVEPPTVVSEGNASAAEESPVAVVPGAGGAWGRSGSLAKTLQQKSAPAAAGSKRSNAKPASSEKAKPAAEATTAGAPRTPVGGPAAAADEEGISVRIGATVPVSPVAEGATGLASPTESPSKLAAKSDPVVTQKPQEKQLLVLPEDIEALIQPEGTYRFNGAAAATSSSPTAPPPMGDHGQGPAPSSTSPSYPHQGHGHGHYGGHGAHPSDRSWAHGQEESYMYDNRRGGYQGQYPHHHGGQRYNGGNYDGRQYQPRMHGPGYHPGYDHTAAPFVPRDHQASYQHQQYHGHHHDGRQFASPPNYGTPMMNHNHSGRGGMAAPPPYSGN